MTSRLPLAVVPLVVLLGSATPARADWLLTPFLGVSFGGDTDSQHVTYGASVAYMGAGIVGLEIDGAFAPDLLAIDRRDDSDALTLMANLIVGAPLGSPGIRPYASGGIGLMRNRVTRVDDILDVNENSFGVNLGAGLYIFTRDHFGLRADLRYFRSIEDADADDDIDVELGALDFWRATVGATFRF